MLITVEDLEKYSGVQGDPLAQTYVTSACEIVRNYLGYNPEATEYDELYDGTGNAADEVTVTSDGIKVNFIAAYSLLPEPQ